MIIPENDTFENGLEVYIMEVLYIYFLLLCTYLLTVILIMACVY